MYMYDGVGGELGGLNCGEVAMPMAAAALKGAADATLDPVGAV